MDDSNQKLEEVVRELARLRDTVDYVKGVEFPKRVQAVTTSYREKVERQSAEIANLKARLNCAISSLAICRDRARQLLDGSLEGEERAIAGIVLTVSSQTLDVVSPEPATPAVVPK